MQFEENWPRGFRGEVFKGVYGRTDRRMAGDRRQVITITHPEPLAQVS